MFLQNGRVISCLQNFQCLLFHNDLNKVWSHNRPIQMTYLRSKTKKWGHNCPLHATYKVNYNTQWLLNMNVGIHKIHDRWILCHFCLSRDSVKNKKRWWRTTSYRHPRWNYQWRVWYLRNPISRGIQTPRRVKTQQTRQNQLIVHLESIQTWQKELWHYNAIEYYQRYRFVNIERIRSFAKAKCYSWDT